ncbi:MAG: hypothetical protein ACO1OC_09770, partial [Tuberibacillus sp.]
MNQVILHTRIERVPIIGLGSDPRLVFTFLSIRVPFCGVSDDKMGRKSKMRPISRTNAVQNGTQNPLNGKKTPIHALFLHFYPFASHFAVFLMIKWDA